MRETVGSLRAYFIVAALLSAIPSVRSLFAQPFGLGTIFSVLVIAFVSGYMYVGIRLKTLLVKSPGQVVGVVLAGGAVVIIYLIVSLVAGSMVGVGSAVVELLIVWYLYERSSPLRQIGGVAAACLIRLHGSRLTRACSALAPLAADALPVRRQGVA